MARAKHTDRTEARRRHRAEQAALAAASTGDAPEDDAPAGGTAAKSTAAKGAAAPPPQRPGIMAALRGAYRPVNLREDLRALPQVVTHWAVLAAGAIAIGATAVFVASTNELGAALDFTRDKPLEGVNVGSVSSTSYLVMNLFVEQPVAGAFLIGFTAKRASWLGGLVYGIVAAICYVVVLLTPAGRLLIGDAPVESYLVQIVFASFSALLFASAAAWYRRFLNLANPNRGARRTDGKARPKPKPKPRPTTAKSGTRSH